jgi:hypothetical protein
MPKEATKDQKGTKQPLTKVTPDTHQETLSSTQEPTKASDPLEATTTKQERYLNARFGDVLDPHADFVHDTETKPECQDQTSASNPQVRYLISERHPSQFHRAFHFPTPIKKDEVTAKMENGILHITAPRGPMPPPVKVQIRNDIVYYGGVVF